MKLPQSLITITLLAMSMACSVVQTRPHFIEPGQCVPSFAVPSRPAGPICYFVYLNNNIFFECQCDCTTGIINKITTRDPLFITAEGMNVTNTLRDCIDNKGLVDRDCMVVLPSGWKACAYNGMLERLVSKSTFDDLPCSAYENLPIEQFTKE